MTTTVILERRGACATITLNRPERMNALDAAMMRDLDAATREVAEDGSVRAVMLRGAGRSFMSGGDVAMFHAEGAALAGKFEAIAGVFHASVKRLRTMPKPVLACVQGAAAGGGLSAMLACDLAIAAKDAYFSLAYAGIGTSPDGGSTFTLPRIVGMRKALELAFLPERFDAQTALSLGLVNWVVENDELEARAREILERLASGPTFAYARTKALFNETWERPMAAQLEAELAAFARCAATADFAEGVGAFVAKRKPGFSGK
jgi:2-(1,2-epoxy-1,2-dihydrophenyl)acetyl-CoA isomerase